MSLGIAEIVIIGLAMLVLLRSEELGKLSRAIGRGYRKLQRLRSEAHEMFSDRDFNDDEGGQR